MEQDRARLYFDLKDLTENSGFKGANFYLAGLPSMVVLLSKNMMADLSLLIPIVIIVF